MIDVKKKQVFISSVLRDGKGPRTMKNLMGEGAGGR